MTRITEFIQEIHKYTTDEYAALEFLQAQDVIMRHKLCPVCESEMYIGTYRTKLVWRCKSQICRKSLNLLSDSIFSKLRIRIVSLILTIYCWVEQKSTYKTEESSGLSRGTVDTIFKILQKAFVKNFSRKSAVFGGIGEILKIDESLLMKRNNKRGPRRHRKHYVHKTVNHKANSKTRKRM